MAAHQPFIPASNTTTPEFTLKAILLGILLAMVMGAANLYFGLYAGLTVSASIPAAVISMAILKGVLRRGTILENITVENIASTGEALAAGVIFTVPALVITGAWTEFSFWPIVAIAISGGLLGVVFMVPLRRSLIVEEVDLVYPEGLACAEVLIAGEKGGASIRPIIAGVIFGGVFKFLSSGVLLLKGAVETATHVGNSLFFFGANLSPALFAVGYIIELKIASLNFIGGAISMLIALPLMDASSIDTENPLKAAMMLWKTQIRYMGVGAMLVGGIWSIINIRHGIARSIRKLFSGFSMSGSGQTIERTDQDMRASHMVLIGLGVMVVMFFLYNTFIQSPGFSLLTVMIMTVAAFFFVAVSSFICGLIGSSSNPVSGMTICTVLATSGLFLLVGFQGMPAIVAVLGVAGVVCCAAAVAGDLSQDLKTALLVGATPRRMQWAQILGVIFPALLMPSILTLLHNAYGIGTGLKAPQATLFASLTQAVFGEGHLPWKMVGIGMGIAVVIILIDLYLKRSGSKFRAYVMPTAIGMYLPFPLTFTIFLGGIMRSIIEYQLGHPKEKADDYGVLMSSGLIAGEAILGIVVAVLIGGGVGGFPITLFEHDGISILAFLALLAIFYKWTKSHRMRNGG